LASRTWNFDLPFAIAQAQWLQEAQMGKGILLWLLGIPIPIIILLLIFWH
jgi:hypothetical protein